MSHYQKITEAAILSCRNKFLLKKFLPNTFVRDIVFNKEVFEFYQLYKDSDLFYPCKFYVIHVHLSLIWIEFCILNFVKYSIWNERNYLTELCFYHINRKQTNLAYVNFPYCLVKTVCTFKRYFILIKLN